MCSVILWSRFATDISRACLLKIKWLRKIPRTCILRAPRGKTPYRYGDSFLISDRCSAPPDLELLSATNFAQAKEIFQDQSIQPVFMGAGPEIEQRREIISGLQRSIRRHTATPGGAWRRHTHQIRRPVLRLADFKSTLNDSSVSQRTVPCPRMSAYSRHEP